MAAPATRLLLGTALIVGLAAGWHSDCRAAGMYTATDLGQVGSGPNPSSDAIQALHPRLGLNLSDTEMAALPSVDVLAGATYPRLVSFRMTPYQNTDSGIVLGVVPLGGSLALPMSSLEYGYAQKQADGTFSPFVPLTYQNPYDDIHSGGITGMASLDAKGNILVTNSYGQKLIDVNTGTTTDLTTLIPPGTLGLDSSDAMIHHAFMAADGTIFADVMSTHGQYHDGSYDHMLMLTLPLSTPEPSTLVTFAVLAMGVTVTRRWSKV